MFKRLKDDSTGIEMIVTDEYERIQTLPENRYSLTPEEREMSNRVYSIDSVKDFEKRKKQWKKQLMDVGFIDVTLSAWEEENGKFSLGDGNTKFAAYKELIEEGKWNRGPYVFILYVKNNAYSSREGKKYTREMFVSETIDLNKYSGFKWNAINKLDSCINSNDEDERKYGEFVDKIRYYGFSTTMATEIAENRQGVLKDCNSRNYGKDVWEHALRFAEWCASIRNIDERFKEQHAIEGLRGLYTVFGIADKYSQYNGILSTFENYFLEKVSRKTWWQKKCDDKKASNWRGSIIANIYKASDSQAEQLKFCLTKLGINGYDGEKVSAKAIKAKLDNINYSKSA